MRTPVWSLILGLTVAPLRPLAAAPAPTSEPAPAAQPEPAADEPPPAPAPVAASPGPAAGTVLVAPPVVRGVAGEQSEASLAAALRAGVSRAEIPLAEPPADAAACDDVDCHVAAGKRAGAAHVATLRVDAVDRDYTVRAALIDVATGQVREISDGCTICGLDDACRIVESLAARLGPLWQAAREEAAARDKLAQSLDQQPRLRISTRPSGATVFVDGEKIGTTPVEHRVTAGHHLVEVERADHVRERREVDLARGSTNDLAIDLRPAGKLPPSPRSRATLISGSVLLGLGVGGLGVMAGFIARGAALERQGDDKVAELEAQGVGGLELTDALADTRARGTRANLLAVVGGAVGGVLLVTGATLVGLSTTNRVRRVAMSPWAGRGLAGLSLTGRF